MHTHHRHTHGCSPPRSEMRFGSTCPRNTHGGRSAPPRGLHDSVLHSPFTGEVQDASVSLGPGSELERLFEKEATRIWRALVAYAGDREVASDAMAEAFAQALARGDELRSPERWVWRAAFRIAAGELKARLRDRALAEDPAYEMPEPPHDLIAALAKLSPNQRAALILHHYAGYSTREIGQILGCSAATVRVHLSQGRLRLRHLLEVT